MKIEMFRSAVFWNFYRPLFVRHHPYNGNWFLSIKLPGYWLRLWGTRQPEVVHRLSQESLAQLAKLLEDGCPYL